MLLKNFNCGLCANQYPLANQPNVTTMAGSNVANLNCPLSYLAGINTTSHYCGNGYSAFYVMIGGGDTQPTKDDYDMADTSIVASDKMVSANQTSTYTAVGGITVSTQWANRSNVPIVVKELGLAYKRDGSTYSKASSLLIARTVLDTPVTVQPGETYAFSYNLKV